MNRKHFLAAMASAATLLAPPVLQAAANNPRKRKHITIPPYLQPGDMIGITSPAGYISEKDIQSAVGKFQEWGFTIKQGNTIGKRDFTFGGTDEERAADLQQMLDDNSIKAILCARGGYGAVRMIDALDFTAFKQNPKWIIGFSDITVFHNHLHNVLGVASIHSKMCNSFPDDWSKAEPIQVETILSIKQALQGEWMQYKAPADEKNRNGAAEGLLVGGNLKIIETLAGTVSDISTKDKILFVEDTGEALYNIDRMFCHLQRTGKLEHLKGLIVGGFVGIKVEAPEDEFGRTVYDIVWEKVKQYNYPVCFGFPVGHQRNNFALKCGVRHRLTVDADGSFLEEKR
jgi:muramoyltetrapeptide carboxypeptidase